LRIPVAREGWPFIVPPAAAACILALVGRRATAIPFAVAAGAFLGFFRDPERTTPRMPGALVAPADGKVLAVAPVDDHWVGPAVRLSIFLSPLDVHVNRIPVAGRVSHVLYTPGRFLPAYRAEAASENERNEIWIEREGQTIICRQVVGMLARRIVCRIGEGAVVSTGERYGIMKFGSRMDLYMPPGTTLSVHVGDRVVSGVTRLARLTPIGGARS
jgi:phosphatidylserine decarboxylase